MGRIASITACIFVLLGFVERAFAEVISVWNFNSLENDGDPESGSFQASNGDGAVSVIGGTLAAFGSVSAGRTSDPDSSDNSQLRLSRFPARDAGNKAAGLVLYSSTAGFESIRLSWDQYNSGSASRYWRVQYTLDGAGWVDHQAVTNLRGGSWVNQNTVSFQDISEANNNPAFGVRIVSEFEHSATGAGVLEYAPVSAANYSSAGTLWIDMVRLEGFVITPGNEPPVISPLPTVFLDKNTASGPIPFAIADQETPADELELSFEASQSEKIEMVEFGGAGTNRFLVIHPANDASGNLTITVRVADSGGKFGERSFVLAILAGNTPPVISRIPPAQITPNARLGPLPFTVSDQEKAPEDLVVRASSSNPLLFPSSNIFLERGARDRTITLDPAPYEVGSATITLAVSDGGHETSIEFEVQVLPEAYFASWDFNSIWPDDDDATGNFEASEGSGFAQQAGSVSSAFGAVAAGSTSDPAETDNSMWRLGRFPSQGTGNKTSGPEFRTSTIGWTNICVLWDQYNSGSASRYWRVQYTTNGVDWMDHRVFETQTSGKWKHRLGASFRNVPGAAQNPNFGFRIVSEFASTAIPPAPDAYLAIAPGAEYSGAGTFWIDMVRVAGDPSGKLNTAPFIDHIPDQELGAGDRVLIPLLVSDLESPFEDLNLTAVADRPDLFAEVAVTNDAGGVFLSCVAQGDSDGEANIAIRVVDPEGLFVEQIIRLIVLRRNEAPRISPVAGQRVLLGQEAIPVSFSVIDDMGPESVTLEATSSNEDVMRDDAIWWQNLAGECQLFLYPEGIGTTRVTIRAADAEGLTHEVVFELLVEAKPVTLSIGRQHNVQLRWPIAEAYRLQSSEDLNEWEDFEATSERGADEFLLDLISSGERRFFRLVQ